MQGVDGDSRRKVRGQSPIRAGKSGYVLQKLVGKLVRVRPRSQKLEDKFPGIHTVR